MEPEVQVKNPTVKKKNTTVIILSVFIAVMLLTASILAFIALQYGYIYKGVHIYDMDVSGMSRQELLQLLESRYSMPASDLSITLKTPLAELEISYPELGVHYDVEAAVEAAYSLGRTGNIFVRLYDIARAGLGGISYTVPQSYNEEKLDEFISRFSEMAFRPVSEGSLLISDDKVILRSGSHGESIDKAEAKLKVIEMIKSGHGGVIEPEVTITGASGLDIDELYDQIVSSPENAYYRKLENNELELVPHKMGRQIDKETLRKIVEEQKSTENTERVLPVEFTNPEITSETAASMLFRDELANYSTTFQTRTQNEKNRMHNISLAASKFNNYILMPDEEFSFNEVVGPRNEKYGYKEAHVFINGRVEDGVGGGICQAVSTLYNAVLMSDLKVLERRNHSFIVTYVPLGQDATAYYGGTDFRFVNTTGWPIKIITQVDDSKVTVIFKGTNTQPDKKVIISNKTLSRTPYKTKYVDDPTLAVGTIIKSQYGSDGYVVETYKTVKSGDTVISQIKLHTSRYKACDEEFRVGIKNPDGTTTPGLAAKMQEAASAGSQTTQPAQAPANQQTPAANTKPAETGSSDDKKVPDTSGKPETPDTSDTQQNQGSSAAPEQTDTPDVHEPSEGPESPGDTGDAVL